MKRTSIALLGVFIIGILVAGGALAHGEFQRNANQENEPGTYHEEMEEILEDGTYEDLETFRAENDGMGGPRWVDSPADFEAWQDRHEEMESYFEENGIEPGQRGMRNSHMGGNHANGMHQRGAGCPYMN